MSQLNKTLLFAIILLTLTITGCITPVDPITSNINGDWIINENNINNSLNDMCILNDSIIWIVGSDGFIAKSNDNGNNWENISSPTEDDIFSVSFITSRKGILCNSNSIYITNDCGNTWNIAYSNNWSTFGRFYDIEFSNTMIGFIVGRDDNRGGVLLQTNDSGETWIDITPSGARDLRDISIFNENKIWVCGKYGEVFSSQDMGESWRADTVGTNILQLTKIQFIDENIGWTGSRDDYLGFFSTLDGGEHWTQVSSKTFRDICGVQSLYFIDKNNGWICQFPFDRLIKTTDGGKNWEFDTEIRVRINAFSFKNDNAGFAVGNNGSIIKFIPEN